MKNEEKEGQAMAGGMARKKELTRRIKKNEHGMKTKYIY